MQSIFTRPRARPPLAAVSSQQNMLAVSTEDELLAALTSLPRSDGACYGRGINIVGDITLTGTVTLGSQHSGLLITSSSRARISTSTPLERGFLISRADDVTISGLFIGSGSSMVSVVEAVDLTDVRNLSLVGIIVSSSSSVLHLITPTTGVTRNLMVDGCRTSGSALSPISLVYGPTGTGASGQGTDLTYSAITRNINFGGGIRVAAMNFSTVSGNLRLGGINVDGGTGSGGYNIVSGNVFTDSVIMNNDGNNAISSNVMSNNNINTTGSVSAGGNSIVGNTNVGAITSNATDAVTSNT